MARSGLITVGFVSLGCAKNRVDSECLAAHLAAAGFGFAPAPERADVVVVNTCAFIRPAKEESIAAVLEACRWKQAGRCRAVIVAGCLPQRYPREVPGALPEVDAFIGLDEAPRIAGAVRRALAGEPPVAAVPDRACAVIEPPAGRPVFCPGPYAYLKIAEGCNHGCSFCAIPTIRGRYRSRPIGRIVAEAESLLARGIRELILIAQDTTRYGCDRGARTNLPALLRALGRIGGRFWIRLLYGYPAHVSPALLDAMADTPQVCRYLDLPIQHADDALLRAMGRPDTAAGLRALFGRVRAALPGVALRTTCLTGFPGETGRRFSNLLAFLDEIRFDHLAVFCYSREEGTPAARLRHTVPASLAEARRRKLLCAQRRRVAAAGAARRGQADVLLVERFDCRRGAWLARSAGQAPEVDGVVWLAAPASRVKPGRFVNARYTAAAGYDLRAELAP